LLHAHSKRGHGAPMVLISKRLPRRLHSPHFRSVYNEIPETDDPVLTLAPPRAISTAG
jgi:hypothetical protein